MDTMRTRMDGDLFAAAESYGALNSRSAAEQIVHWARIGREIESSPEVRHREIEVVLAGDGNYDALREHEQAIVRATWDDRLARRQGSLNFAEEFRTAGLDYVEADEHGNLIHGAVAG
ncbi:TA system antitoxin ParD family protein [Nocardioides sp.]|uniref:TA system antitoxin ParD family protein n=1 Tax=Nocardioides sp. TaxID=35761 RepID=UPI002C9FB243|nr:hypothetical protein [Nocardioides sp.]HSX67974.1 hypothetical protein [Nocardioides sp.]